MTAAIRARAGSEASAGSGVLSPDRYSTLVLRHHARQRWLGWRDPRR